MFDGAGRADGDAARELHGFVALVYLKEFKMLAQVQGFVGGP